MVEQSEQLRIQFIKHELTGDHAQYLVKVIGPGGISFDIRDRYSSMRTFQSMIKNNLDLPERELRALPAFPKKKAFGNTNADFLNTRMNQLENFFRAFVNVQ